MRPSVHSVHVTAKEHAPDALEAAAATLTAHRQKTTRKAVKFTGRLAT